MSAKVYQKELGIYQGKLTSLKTLLAHPAAKNPKLAAPLKQLATNLRRNLTFKSVKCETVTEDIKELVELSFKATAILENILIQVIIQGKNYDEVVAEELMKPDGFMLPKFK